MKEVVHWYLVVEAVHHFADDQLQVPSVGWVGVMAAPSLRDGGDVLYDQVCGERYDQQDSGHG